MAGQIIDEQEVKFVKSIYGEEKYKNRDIVQFGDKILVGWHILGYPSLADLEAQFNENEILELHAAVQRSVYM
ncbi:MAG: hypothetical protein QG567_1737 [Campylobacterota bacterium]|nr:hypothetical protein [Campylobacterota bacterium]